MALDNLEQQATPQGLIGFSAEDGITAAAGGGQANATQLEFYVNNVSTVATAADSVMLPPATRGSIVWVANNGANSMQVFGQATNPVTGAGDTIIASTSVTPAATGTGVAQASKTLSIYVCYAPGKWKQGNAAIA